MKQNIKPRCPACSSASTEEIGKLPDNNLFAGVFLDQMLTGGSLYRCDSCSLKFRYPTNDSVNLGQLYDNQQTLSWPTESERPDWALIAQYLAKHKTHGRVLDYGCYTGGLLSHLGDSYERYGVEINGAAAAVASKVTALPTFSSIDDIPLDLRFDVIITCDVVEHLINPMEAIRQLGSLLQQNGILIVTTGDAENSLWKRFGANWWYCFYPEHVSFISKTWLNRNAEALGLTMLHFENFKYSNLGPVSRLIHVILTYTYGYAPRLYLMVRRYVDMLRGKPGTTSVTGVGVSDDHLFAVMCSTNKSNPAELSS